MNLDTAIFAQIQPFLLKSEDMELGSADRESLIADMYLTAYNFHNKENKKYRERIAHLETLKSGKDFEFVENLSEQQESIVVESEDKKLETFCNTYNGWIDQYFERKDAKLRP